MIRIIQKSVIILISFTFLVSTFSFTPTRAKADETKDTNTKNVQETSSENEMIVKVNGKEVHLLWPVLKVGAQIMVAAPDLAYALGAEFKYYPGCLLYTSRCV